MNPEDEENLVTRLLAAEARAEELERLLELIGHVAGGVKSHRIGPRAVERIVLGVSEEARRALEKEIDDGIPF